MEIKELLEAYLALESGENKNLINIAFDELESEQYEDAVTHFDQLYVKDSNDYMSYFFRAYCKSHCGKRGDVYPDSQKLTSAFEMASKKAVANKKSQETNISLLLRMYDDAMDNLAYNAVEEVHVSDNGNTYTTNPDKYKITDLARKTIAGFINGNTDIINKSDRLTEFSIEYLKGIVDYNLNYYGPMIVALDPSYQTILDEKIKKLNAKKRITKIVIALIIIVIAGFVVFSMFL